MAAPPILHRRRVSRAAFACVLALAACADGPSVLLTEPGVPAPLPPDALEALLCEADVRAETVICQSHADTEAGGASLARTLGGQHVNVRVASSNVQYDPGSGIFSMDVTVQNLLLQRMGTADGSTVSGVSVFFHSGPNVTGNALGSAEVRNPDGYGIFTSGAPQPYFHWNEVLPLNATSAPRPWEFDVSSADVRFQFIVYIRTELLPVVVFDRSMGGNRDVYRVALDGSDLVRLTTHAADDRSPTVAVGRMVFATYRHGLPDLYAMPLAGGTETRLTATARVTESDPALSLDGTRLAYASDAALGISKVWRANADGTGAVRATPTTFGSGASPEADPAWSPGGDRLALVGTAGGTSDVFGMAEGAVPQALVASSFADVNPAYSPDGRFMVYATDATGGGDLYLLRLQTGEVTRLTSGPDAEMQPSFTQDGRIVYLRSFSGGAELRWMNPGVPGSGRAIPLPAGGRPERPSAVVF